MLLSSLGGMGVGTVEESADGSLRDWNILALLKVQLDEALIGLRGKAQDDRANTWTLRTHPPIEYCPFMDAFRILYPSFTPFTGCKNLQIQD